MLCLVSVNVQLTVCKCRTLCITWRHFLRQSIVFPDRQTDTVDFILDGPLKIAVRITSKHNRQNVSTEGLAKLRVGTRREVNRAESTVTRDCPTRLSTYDLLTFSFFPYIFYLFEDQAVYIIWRNQKRPLLTSMKVRWWQIFPQTYKLFSTKTGKNSVFTQKQEHPNQFSAFQE